MCFGFGVGFRCYGLVYCVLYLDCVTTLNGCLFRIANVAYLFGCA